MTVNNDGLIRMLLPFGLESIIVTSPQALSEILVTKSYVFEKPGNLRNFLSLIVGWGLITSEGSDHKLQRRKLMPAFSFRHIKELYGTMWRKSQESVLAITSVCGSEGSVELDISSWASRSALDIIGLAGIGQDFGAIQDENNSLAKSYNKLNPAPEDFFLIGIRGFIPEGLAVRLPMKRSREILKTVRDIRQVCLNLVRRKHSLLAEKKLADNDILSTALKSGLFSEEGLVDQMMTFLAAGHETSAASLTWAIYMLCKYPHVQATLRKEVRENLPPAEADTAIRDTDIDGMLYLNAVCSEVLRTHSPVPVTSRVATEDTTVQNQFIPRGTIIWISPWATNKDPKLWGPDASEFKPERWLNDKSGGALNNYAFMTFLHGPRSCIGASFARAELACTIAAWVGRFSFELKDKSLLDENNIAINASVTAKPAGGLQVIVRQVHGH